MYVGDFDENGRAEQLVTFYIGDEEVLFPTYGEVTQQLPMIKKKFLFAKDFARASIADLVGPENLDNARRYEVYILENAWFENAGEKGFLKHDLPQKMQFAPIRCFIASDFDGNGSKDLLTAGNFYEVNIERGRYDADYGNILFADKAGIDNGMMQSLHLDGQVRCALTMQAGPNEILIIARNNAPVKVLRLGPDRADL
jgi:hypothetical protein